MTDPANPAPASGLPALCHWCHENEVAEEFDLCSLCQYEAMDDIEREAVNHYSGGDSDE